MGERETTDSTDLQELLRHYNEVYGQLAALKHIIYSSTLLTDPESAAVLFSRQMRACISAGANSIWLVNEDGKVAEVARNGELVAPHERVAIEIDSVEAIRRAMREHLVIWGAGYAHLQTFFPTFLAPDLFPIKAHSETVGFMAVDQVEPSKREEYQFIAQFIGMILRISRLHDEVSSQRRELEELTAILLSQNAQLYSLHHVGMKIVELRNPRDLCRLVTEAIVHEFGAHGAAAFIFEDNPTVLVAASESGEIVRIRNMRLPIESEKAVRQAIESGRIFSYKDFSYSLELNANVLRKWIIFPFKGRDRVLGVLVVESGDMDINDPIAILVNHASMVLDNLLIVEETKKVNILLGSRTEQLMRVNESLQEANIMLERLSTIDYLTALHNHRYFQDRFEVELARARRYNKALGLIMIDVNRFKWINDFHGHSAGDEVLREISRRIKENLRCTDIVARYGGDEIAMLLPEADEEVTRSVAEKLKTIVSREPVLVDGKSIPVAVSCGVASYPGPDIDSKQSLFDKADQALYRAKGSRGIKSEQEPGRPHGIEMAASDGAVQTWVDSRPSYEDLGRRIRALEEECLGLIGYLDGRKRAEARLNLIARLNRMFATEADPQRLYEGVLNISLKATESSLGYFAYVNQDGDLVSPAFSGDVRRLCPMEGKEVAFPREKWMRLRGTSPGEQRSILLNQTLKVPSGHVELDRVICVGVVYGDELIGQICAANKPVDYSGEDLDVLEDIAKSMAPALKNKLEQERHRQSLERLNAESLEKNRKLEEANEIIRKQNERITGINHVIRRLSEAVNFEEACEIMLTALEDYMNVKKVVLCLKRENDNYRLIRHKGLPVHASRDIVSLLQQDHVSRTVLRTGRRFGKSDLEDNNTCWNEWFESWTVWPLQGRRGALGFLVLDDSGPELSDSLEILAWQGAVFFETTMLHEEMLTIKQQLMEANTRLECITESCLDV